jgi:SAM-dependent methyltransferase
MSIEGKGWLVRALRTTLSHGSRLLRVLESRRTGPWRARNDPVRGRRRALREETDYWRQWLSAGGGKYAAEYAYRFDPTAEVGDPALREVLTDSPQHDISILDVGAGPASIVGCRFHGKVLTVVAVDPLANEYNRLLREIGVVAPTRTEFLDGERLVERFGPDHFDIAYSRNAVDHAVDPLLIVESMLAVVRQGGHIVLRHVRNEGVRQAYIQLHQWNFDERDGQFVVWRLGHETNVGQALAGRAEVTCRRELHDKSGTEEWIVCVIRKLTATRSPVPPSAMS